ncbi:MAG: ferrous iron transport protein B [Oscillospiraceae bacterium]|nr:ferrous iron transport protein B [Oscillospiraceae bacterium]
MPTIALAGNPNSGKTTLFNALTGEKAHVGNWPGVTVEKKSARIKGGTAILLDLPGVYSLTPFTPEETVTAAALREGSSDRPDGVLNIVDGTNPERNLYLTLQLLELGIPVVVAVNFADVLRRRGVRVKYDVLEKELGCPVLPISARTGKGLPELLAALGKMAAGIRMKAACPIGAPLQAMPTHCVLDTGRSLQEEDRIAWRYDLAAEIVTKAVRYPKRQRRDIDKLLDRIFLHKWLAFPLFGAVMSLVFLLSVSTIGRGLSDFVSEGIFGEGLVVFGWRLPGIPELLSAAFESWNVHPLLSRFVTEGLLGGVGMLLGFVPQLAILFLSLSFLESCGYLARVAFLLDRAFRRFGLSGRCFIPFLLAAGCGVPALSAARTLRSDRERKLTLITCTFLPCSAKLPVVSLLAAALFDGGWWFAALAYLAGIAAILLSCFLLKGFISRHTGEEAPFLIELPPYRLPDGRTLWQSVGEKTAAFLRKATTVILLCAAAVWLLSNFGIIQGHVRAVGLEESFLSAIGRALLPLFRPIGFTAWEPVVATLTGWIAKENAVATLGVLYRVTETADVYFHEALRAGMPTGGWVGFLFFNLLSAPCAAAMHALKREIGSYKWTVFALGYQTGFAYGICLILRAAYILLTIHA